MCLGKSALKKEHHPCLGQKFFQGSYQTAKLPVFYQTPGTRSQHHKQHPRSGPSAVPVREPRPAMIIRTDLLVPGLTLLECQTGISVTHPFFLIKEHLSKDHISLRPSLTDWVQRELQQQAPGVATPGVPWKAPEQGPRDNEHGSLEILFYGLQRARLTMNCFSPALLRKHRGNRDPQRSTAPLGRAAQRAASRLSASCTGSVQGQGQYYSPGWVLSG